MAKRTPKPFEEWSTSDLDGFRAEMVVKSHHLQKSIQTLEQKMEAYTMNRRLLDAARASLKTLEQCALESLDLAREHAPDNDVLITYTKQQLERYRHARASLPTVSTRQPEKPELLAMGAELETLRYKLKQTRQRAEEVHEVLQGRR